MVRSITWLWGTASHFQCVVYIPFIAGSKEGEIRMMTTLVDEARPRPTLSTDLGALHLVTHTIVIHTTAMRERHRPAPRIRDEPVAHHRQTETVDPFVPRMNLGREMARPLPPLLEAFSQTPSGPPSVRELHPKTQGSSDAGKMTKRQAALGAQAASITRTSFVRCGASARADLREPS